MPGFLDVIQFQSLDVSLLFSSSIASAHKGLLLIAGLGPGYLDWGLMQVLKSWKIDETYQTIINQKETKLYISSLMSSNWIILCTLNRTLGKKKNEIFPGTNQIILSQKRKEALYKSLWGKYWTQLNYVCQVCA